MTALTAIGIAGATLYVPSFPDLGRDFAASVGQVQLTLTTYLLGVGVGQLLFGPLSDRLGRRPVILGGTALCAAASVACMLAPTIGALTLARLFQAFGACTGMVVTRAIVRDLFERHEAARAVSLLGIAIAVAPALAPIVGGLLHEAFGWRSTFAALALMAAAAGLWAWRSLPETNVQKLVERSFLRTMLESYRDLVRAPAFRAFALVVGGIFGTLYAYVAAAPALLIDVLGLTPALFGLLSALGPLGFIAGSSLSSRVTIRLGIERLVTTGLWVSVAGGMLMLALPAAGHVSVAGVIGPIVLWSVGFGLSFPNAIAGAVSVLPRVAGAAAALTGFLQLGGGAFGTMAAYALPKGSALAMGAAVAGLSAATLIGWLATRPRA